MGAFSNTFSRSLGSIGSKSKPSVDYSGIIASLNLLTDTSDSYYDGTNPTVDDMILQLDEINNEIV